MSRHHHHVTSEPDYEAVLYHDDEAEDHELYHERLELGEPCRKPGCVFRRYDD